jgi:Subtilase family
MPRPRIASSLASLVLVLASQSAWSQDQPADAKPSSFRIEFLGKDPAADWAKAVSSLIDAGIVPTETLDLEKGQDPCGAVLAKLHFSDLKLGCSDEIKKIINKLNPSLPSPAPIGQVVRYPNLPIEQMKWRAAFDSSIPEEKDRLDRVNDLWKKLKVDEKSAGTQRNLQFKGIATELNVPTSPENYKLLQTIEHFNKDLGRYETRAIAQESDPVTKQRYAVNTPIDWAQSCSAPPTPTAAAPPYISLLNGTANPTCASSCTQPGNPDCPEIVLIDQQVDPHPDLTAALGRPSSPPTGSWCPFGKYDATRNHGTHLAGIMVSAGATTGFKGLAPNVSLDSQNIADSGIKKLLDDKYNVPHLKIYVYAGQFKNDYFIIDQQTRLSKPPQVEDMLVAPSGLWVVAAGQEPAIDVGKLTTHSPMNLGDQKNVIVVTSCDDCYTPDARVSPWASYSSDGLVTVAAPGGSGERAIPSTINVSNYGLSYGTSQATALVAGLAAAMASCFPQRYVTASLLKQRLETISRPPPSQEMSERVSAGIIDASLAFRDPYQQWIKLTGDTLKSAKNIWFCTEVVRLKNISDDDEMEIAPIPVKRIRGIFREQLPSGKIGWRIKYQLKPGASLLTTPLVDLMFDAPNAATKPLFYLEGSTDLPPRPFQIKEVESLAIGLQGGSIPPGFRGCM